MATKQDLEKEVARLNRKYVKNQKNELQIYRAYGGYTVMLVETKKDNTIVFLMKYAVKKFVSALF